MHLSEKHHTVAYEPFTSSPIAVTAKTFAQVLCSVVPFHEKMTAAVDIPS